MLFLIVKRHLYYHIVRFGIRGSDFGHVLDRFSKLVSETPRILYYVRTLFSLIWKQFDEFANNLLTFPILECIMITTSKRCGISLMFFELH